MSSSIERRVQRLEAREGDGAIPGTVIVTGDREDADRIQAEMEAEGRYRPGWPIIIVTGVPRGGQPFVIAPEA